MAATTYHYVLGDTPGPAVAAASGEVYAETGTTSIATDDCQFIIEDGVSKQEALAALKIIRETILADQAFVIA